MASLWCIIGDFNNILEVTEKRGNHERPNWMITGFRQAVQDCELVDIPLEGYPFMLSKSLGTERAVEVKLDRAMASNNWLTLFPNVQLTSRVASTSNHCPLLLRCEVQTMVPSRPYRFRFENAWLQEQDVGEVVAAGWARIQQGNVQDRRGGCVVELAS